MAYQRPPAPEELAEIESLCNSAMFLHGRDAFADVASTRAWLTRYGHNHAAESVDATRLARLVQIREAIRGHLEGTASARTRINDLAAELLSPPRWDAEGTAFLPVALQDPVLALGGAMLAHLAAADLSGRRARLKVCRSQECRWVFYDRSPANNSTWCSMDICGARNKMRAYRSRRETG